MSLCSVSLKLETSHLNIMNLEYLLEIIFLLHIITRQCFLMLIISPTNMCVVRVATLSSLCSQSTLTSQSKYNAVVCRAWRNCVDVYPLAISTLIRRYRILQQKIKDIFILRGFSCLAPSGTLSHSNDQTKSYTNNK